MVSEIHSFPYSVARRFILVPQYDQTIPESNRFTNATPSGRLEILVDGIDAAKVFAINQTFYLDLTPAP